MKRFAPVAAALLLSAAWCGAAGAAPLDRPIRVAVVNMPRIFNEVQEKKDIESRLRQDQQNLATQQKAKLEALQKLKAEGGNYRQGSEQYEDWRRRYRAAGIEQQAWAETAKQEMDWRLKRQTRDMFEKINAAVTDYATSNQIDLVVSDQQQTLTDDELEKVPPEQVGPIMDRRRVIYASKSADISDAIIAALDAKYKAGGGGQGPVGRGPVITNPGGATQAADTTPRRSGNNR